MNLLFSLDSTPLTLAVLAARHDFRLTLFWIIHLIMLGLFGLEMLWVLSIWLRGRVPGLPADASRWQKFWRVVGITLRAIFSPRLGDILRALVMDGLLHRPLLQENPRRWIAHIATFGAFFLLGVLSTITGLAVEILDPIFHVEHPIVKALLNFDHPVVAFLNDFLGLVMLLGLILIAYRRFVEKDPQLRTLGGDKVLLVLLFLIVLTGYPLEAVRLLAERPFAETAAWGFIGYPLARLLEPLNLPWEGLHFWGFWLHAALPTALMFYMPFSKFFHVFMSPLVVVINSLGKEEHRSAAGTYPIPTPSSH